MFNLANESRDSFLVWFIISEKEVKTMKQRLNGRANELSATRVDHGASVVFVTYLSTGPSALLHFFLWTCVIDVHVFLFLVVFQLLSSKVSSTVPFLKVLLLRNRSSLKKDSVDLPLGLLFVCVCIT